MSDLSAPIDGSSAPRPDLRAAYVLSTLVAALAAAASAVGAFTGVYRDNLFVSSQLVGNDWVTLFVAVPLLLAALALSRRGSRRARLAWLGVLDYMLYNYGFYLFGAAFNPLFLVYSALFALSILALVLSVPRLDAGAIAGSFSARFPARMVAGWMAFVALGLGGVWTAVSIESALSGKPPAVVAQTGHPTSVVFALDLTILVPFLVLGALLLWRRRPWGFVVAAIVNVKNAGYTLALTAMGLNGAQLGVEGSADLIPLWAGLFVGSVVACALIFGSLRSDRGDEPRVGAQG